MSFQAYLDGIEKKTGKTPQELLELAHEHGFGPNTATQEFADWLSGDFGVGRGNAMALFHVLKNGPRISSKHVGGQGTHRDESDLLRLDGIANRDSPAS